jgi:hypothetical protein
VNTGKVEEYRTVVGLIRLRIHAREVALQKALFLCPLPLRSVSAYAAINDRSVVELRQPILPRNCDALVGESSRQPSSSRWSPATYQLEPACRVIAGLEFELRAVVGAVAELNAAAGIVEAVLRAHGQRAASVFKPNSGFSPESA